MTRYMPIDPNLFIQNRAKTVKGLKPNSIAVFNANDRMPTSADGTLPFIQQTDLFYLTGIDQEESILLLCPDAEEKHKEVLFVKETNEEIALWEGEKYTKASAEAVSGIRTVYWTHEFERVFRALAVESEYIYLNTNEHLRADPVVETRDMRFVKWCRDHFPLHTYGRLAPILRELRMRKSESEILLIQEACAITEKAFRRALAFIQPGVWEYEIEAELTYEFIRNRSRGSAFAPIVASGKQTCTLHYVKNNRQCRSGDLILMDFGAEYANYAADLTRTVPANGQFTRRQRQVYEAVLRVQRAAIAMMKPGTRFLEYQKEVGRVVEGELIGLGLLDAKSVKEQPEDAPLYKKYFMHGISHHLGLDVHDVSDRLFEFAPGMVLTCEPGIYIQEEGLGIRLENDILITRSKPVDLTAEIPIEADEVEALMAKKTGGKAKKR